MRTIYDFHSTERPSASQAGGKALKLMEMFQENFPVPRGMVLTTDFFTSWTDVLRKSESWEKLSSVDSEVISQSSSELQTLCSSLHFNEAQKKEFDEAFSLIRQESFGE